MTRPHAGRPPAEDPRDRRLALRFTAAEYVTVLAAAALADKPPSTWLQEVAVREAEREIERGR